MEFEIQNFRAWKVMGSGAGKSWKVMENNLISQMVATFSTHIHVFGFYINCQCLLSAHLCKINSVYLQLSVETRFHISESHFFFDL